MNRTQIMEVLMSVRSLKEGEGDPIVEESFAAMEKDLALKKIWEQQQQWDLALKRSIQSIPVPMDLKEKILLKRRSEEENEEKVPSKILSFSNSFWIPLAAAALVILSFITLNFNDQDQSRNFARFEEKAVGYTQGFFMLSKNTPQLTEAREWLKRKGTPHTFQIPFHIEAMSQFGCKQVEFCGIRSSMICFEIEGIKKEVHLFVVDKANVENLPSFGVPDFHEKSGNAVASWSDENHGYILTGGITLDQMKSLF